MPPSAKIIAIGDSTKDVFITIKEAKVSCVLHTDACTLCLNYADKIPVESVTQIDAAGNAANAAVGTCRLGHESVLVSIVGDDHEGHDLYTALQCEDIDRSFIIFDKKHGTNHSTILNYQGERTILMYYQTRNYVFPKNLPAAAWVYYTSLGEGHLKFERELLGYLKKHSKTQLLFNPGTHQLRRGARGLASVLKQTHTLVINTQEAELLLEETETHPIPSLLARLQRKGPRLVVITDGEKGSWVRDEQGTNWFLPIFPGEAKERTGAGDAYATGFVNALIDGKDIPEAMRWGNANSWNVVRHIGPQAGLLTKETLGQVLKKFKTIEAKRVA
ncbi:MAG: carbohydrate kinase family protein [Candidatus Uhrbacteria bacterium]|nr:carbohydrate kinase family protein [Candidatus Uhrbacteria bacterium]